MSLSIGVHSLMFGMGLPSDSEENSISPAEIDILFHASCCDFQNQFPLEHVSSIARRKIAPFRLNIFLHFFGPDDDYDDYIALE